MRSVQLTALDAFAARYPSNAALQSLRKQLAEVTGRPDTGDTDVVIRIYEQAVALIESEMQADGLDESTAQLYQRLFRELEERIADHGEDSRHKFVIVIPVADRPIHLRRCLESLLTLCRAFVYGGHGAHHFKKVSVIIADDSRDSTSITANRAIAEYFDGQGLETLYFGQDEQLAYVRQAEQCTPELGRVLGRTEPKVFFHKGSSIMRNIAYLKLNELAHAQDNVLFYFIDSDQEFRVPVPSENEDLELYAINYLYKLDRLFARHDVSIVTGKVVGDPPVSPSVMASTFLEDVISFLQQMAASDGKQPCQFHQPSDQKVEDAAYHDMANLFGFAPAAAAFRYRCSLSDAHDNRVCFASFATKLKHFFYGEHPTRKSHFPARDSVTGTKPARTVYTGNYILTSESLRYFIPFATLKLRMAGPVLGRIIQSEIDDRFVSANLPMLHRRTVEEIGQSEFRPGIDREAHRIDLSGEFERQFFGDVMLFSIKKLTEHGYPQDPLSRESIRQAIEETHDYLRRQYGQKQTTIIERLESLRRLMSSAESWWNQSDDLDTARAEFAIFLDNIERNFGADALSYQRIDADTVRTERHHEIAEAIAGYGQDRTAWERLLANWSQAPHP